MSAGATSSIPTFQESQKTTDNYMTTVSPFADIPLGKGNKPGKYSIVEKVLTENKAVRNVTYNGPSSTSPSFSLYVYNGEELPVGVLHVFKDHSSLERGESKQNIPGTFDKAKLQAIAPRILAGAENLPALAKELEAEATKVVAAEVVR